jgi:hypothetical protein
LSPNQQLARQVKLYLCHRYSGKKLRKIAEQSGVSESGVTQASRRIQLKQKNDKKFGKLITKTMKKLALSNVYGLLPKSLFDWSKTFLDKSEARSRRCQNSPFSQKA